LVKKQDLDSLMANESHKDMFGSDIPEPLPPHPPIDMNSELMRLLSDADRALGVWTA
jgi:hypothetical protein